MHLGLRGRILLLVLVALAPPTLVALIVALQERREARVHALADVEATGRLVRTDVKRVLSVTASVLGAFSRDLASHPDRESCERLLELLPRASRRYSSVGVARPDGQVYCGATQMGLAQPMNEVDVSRAAWFQEAQRTGTYALGDLGTDPLTHMRALVAAQPFQTARHTRPSVLFGAIDVRGLANATVLQDAPRGTAFVLFDNRGRIIARAPPTEHAVGRRLRNLAFLRAVLRERRGAKEVKGPDGVSRIQAFAPVGGVAGDRLYLTAGRRSAAVFAVPNRDLRRFVLLTLVGAALALGLSFLVTKFLIQRWSSAVVSAARRFGAGDMTARAPAPRGLGELTDVAQALNAAAEDIEHRQEAQARLLAELVAAEEETRRRVAADIHDDTAQAVAAAGLRIDALVAELKDPDAREAGVQARKALAQANRRLRMLLFELRPPALDEAGLAAALELYLSDAFTQDRFDWRVENYLDTEPSPEVRAILYRVALEALTNVRKHARASLVEVLLERRGVGIAMRVRDDGAGFDLPAPDAPVEPGHIGLVTMRERAEAAGGRFALSSTPGGGTTVDFWMPERNGVPSPGSRGA
jgi:signal transduction histidine kinase